MRPNETHNTHFTVDPRLEQQYMKDHLTPNEEAWPYDKPFPLDFEVAKHYTECPTTDTSK